MVILVISWYNMNMGRCEKTPSRVYDFIDYNDTLRKHGRTHYKARCKKCHGDRGYKRPNKFNQQCMKCQVIFMRSGITSDSRKKHSKSMKGKTPWNKLRSPEQVKLRHSVSSLVNKRLRLRNGSKRGESFFNIIGYKIEDLTKHIEAQFKPGMTWDNYGIKGWHIDHIKPDSLFKYNSMNDVDFKKSWALSNLQPLWASDNLKKSNKVEL